MGSVYRRLRRAFDSHVDTLMDRSSKAAAYAADPQWKVRAYHRWLGERDDVFAEPEPEPVLSGFELEVEMRGIISFCEDFLCGFEDDRDQQGVVETLERIRKLPPL